MVFLTKDARDCVEQLFALKFQGEKTSKDQIEGIVKTIVETERQRILNKLRDLTLDRISRKFYLYTIFWAIFTPREQFERISRVALNYARLVIQDVELPEKKL